MTAPLPIDQIVDRCVEEQPADGTGELRVASGGETPDVGRVARDVGLGEDHEPGSGVSDFGHRLDGGLQRGVSIQQDGRSLNDCHLHGLHEPSLGTLLGPPPN